MHNAVYSQLGLNRRLAAYDPKNENGFLKLAEQLRAGDIAGLCVTIPYKKIAATVCDNLTQTAQRIAACNYIRRESDGSLTGHNTDAGGFAAAVTRKLGLILADCNTIICGTGGTAAAITDALLQAQQAQQSQPNSKSSDIRNSARITIVSRTALPDASLTTLSYNQLTQLSTSYDLLVNTTPLGMKDDQSPVSADWLKKHVGHVYDVVYRKSGTTPLVSSAQRNGIPAADGLSMLKEQAILGMDFWNLQQESGIDDDTIRSIIDSSFL